MENNIKDKPKVTYKEVKRKMKKLTLTQKNRIKEDKKEQKAKEKAEKQRISQRVKININIPSSVNKSGQPIFNPLNQSSREQISLLNSINEQLKNKNKPASINDMFKIPARTIDIGTGVATQTEPIQFFSQGTDYEPTQQYSQGSQTRVKQREQSTQHQGTGVAEPQVNRVIETQTEREDEDFSQGMEDINKQLQERLAQAKLPEQFSPKVEIPIPIIKEPTIPIISKPEETSNENIIEKVTRKGRPKMTDEEKKQRAEQRKEERAREQEVERQIDEAEARLVEDTRERALAEKQRQKETGMQRRAREKSQVEEQFQIDLKDAEKGLTEEMALRKKMNEEEIENTPAMMRKIKLNELLTNQQSLRQQVEDERLRLKALKEQNEKDREIKRKNYEEYLVLEKQKELKEKVEKDIRKRGEPKGENVKEKVKEIEARRKANEADNRKAEQKKEQEQIRLVQTEYKQKEKEQKEKRGLDNAFNMLIQFSNPVEERKLTEAYNTGFLKKEDIRNKLKELKNSTTNKKLFTAKEIDEIFK